MSANMTPSERRGAYNRANARAIAETAQILRTLAQHDSHTDPFRGDLGKAQASVLDAVSRHVATLPREITTEALAVVTAVDRLTGNRRTTSS